MGGFTAEFRGFQPGRGRGATIPRTADTAGLAWRKNFLKRGEKPKNWGSGGAGRRVGDILNRVCGAILGLETRPLAALLERE